ncbi:mucin-7, partial [Triticum aestivum]|uniref:mucin-7 n=1 Tax=Triticum aestivum TaxID=4565 RepID=UPI001D005503
MGLSPPSRPNISASPPTPSVAFAYCSPGATATGTRPCRTSSPAPPRGDKGAVPSTPRALPSTHRSPLAPPRSLSCPRTRHLLQIHRRARSLPLASLCHGQQAHLASPLRPQRPPSSAASTTETKRAGTPSIVEPALCFHLRPPKAAAVVLLHRASPEPAHAHLQVRDPVAAADAAVIDYVTDDPSILSEQPDGVPLEPEATVDGYYYVETAD